MTCRRVIVLNSECEHLVEFFFFQAEDGIRDYKVTGVQTCALPICGGRRLDLRAGGRRQSRAADATEARRDRKSTRLNSSHLVISYAVFCLKKKKTTKIVNTTRYRVVHRTDEIIASDAITYDFMTAC